MEIYTYEIFNIPDFISIYSEKEINKYSKYFKSEKRLYFFSCISAIEYKKTLYYLSRKSYLFKNQNKKYIIKKTTTQTATNKNYISYYYEKI